MTSVIETITSSNTFLIAIIGSGPIGLECGLQALNHGYQFIIFESGNDIASNVRSWSHVRLFTPLHMNVSSLGKSYLSTNIDENVYLTGNEYIEYYLRPISQRLQSHTRLHHRIVSIGRRHVNEFVILVENGQTAREEYIMVNCVIDASGSYGCPNFAGLGYLPAINERTLRAMVPSPISYLIPSELDKHLIGKRILLVGKGYSAATSAVFLAKLKKQYPETELFWVIKQAIDHLPYYSNPDEPFEQGRQLIDEANKIYTDGFTFSEIYTNTVITQFNFTSSSATVLDIVLDTSPPQIIQQIHYVIINTGLQPDRSLYANLNVQECHYTKASLSLATKILSHGSTDCMKQITHGTSSMLTTEKNFFIVGNKSYGKLNYFLMKIGFEQVDEVFEIIRANCDRIENT